MSRGLSPKTGTRKPKSSKSKTLELSYEVLVLVDELNAVERLLDDAEDDREYITYRNIVLRNMREAGYGIKILRHLGVVN